MSTRYLWKKYSVNYEIGPTTNTISNMFSFSTATTVNSSPYYGILSKKCVEGQETGYFDFPEIGVIIRDNGTWSSDEYPYFSTSENYEYGKGYKWVATPSTGGNWRAYGYSQSSDWKGYIQFIPSEGGVAPSKLFKVGKQSKAGDFIGYVSSSSSSTYPNNGESNGYWYEYVGLDDFEIQSVNLVSYTNAGETATVAIYSSSGIPAPTYTYQYSINGGSYTNLVTTTNSYYNFIIPSNATTIQLRASMTDNIGNTTGYVYSSVYNLNSSSSGSGNTGGKIKAIYVGVNGVARKVV